MHAVTSCRAFLIGTLLAIAAPASAQVETDIAGHWDQPNLAGGGQFSEETQDRGGGPDLGDFAGLPINAAARFKASTYSPSWLTVPEHQCIPHPSTYAYRSPGALSIVPSYDPVTERLTAYRVYGSYGLGRTIWMDGRDRPADNAPRTWEGFSLGRWDGDRLIVETTHVRTGFLRRNGIVHSDSARMIEHFMRRENVLTIVTAVDDPLYLDEPFVRSSDYRRNTQINVQLMQFGDQVDGGTNAEFNRCAPVDELAVDRWRVPHYLPGKNTEIDMFSKNHNVPMEASMGGTQTMYPEYMARVRQLLNGAAPSTMPASPARSPRRADAAAANAGARVRSQHVQGQVWMIAAGTTNVTVQIGRDGVLVVDPGSEQLAPAVLEEIQRLAPGKRVRVIVNTSADAALVGGNVLVGAASPGKPQRAAILAHEGTGLRMAERGVVTAGLPSEFFYRGIRELYFNDEPIEIIHVPSAFSDGDVIVFFRRSDVLTAGRLLDDTAYPRIESGGSLDGIVDGLNRVLLEAVAAFRAQGGTMVVPVTGRPYDESDVAEYRDMLSILRDRLKAAIAEGRDVRQVIADRISQDYDVRYGAADDRAIEAFLTAAYNSLAPGGTR